MKSIGIGGRIAALLISLALLNSANAADYSLKSLGETEKKVREVVKKVLPATVGLRGAGPAVGTGVVVSKDGLILTAGHVAAATRDDITVSFPDGRKVKAKALGADYSRDSAMVQIIEEGEYPFVKVGKSDHLKVDDWCLALGHAGGFQIDRSPPVRLGRVVDRGGNLLLSTDCALIGGDSGGPLIDLEGNVIGIHSRIGQTLSQNHHVPISAFHYAWDRLKKGERWGTLDGGGRRRRGPRTGIRPAGGDDKGVRIRVQEDSHAAKAGLEDDDIVTKVDGKEVAASASSTARCGTFTRV